MLGIYDEKEMRFMTMQNNEELDLIALAQTGDEDAFQELYRRYEKTIHYMAYRILNNHHDAQDATQAVFIQLHHSIKDLKCPQYFRLWLNRIVMGKCNNIYRKKRIPVVDMDEPSYTNRLVEEHRDYIPRKHTHFQNDKELVDHMIMNLSYEQRQAVVLFYFQELSLQEIADITGEALGTVKSRLFLAKRNLKKQIESYESRENTTIDFLSMDVLITAAVAGGFQAFSLPVKSLAITSILSKAKNLFATSGGKVVAASLVFTTSTVAVAGVYQAVNNNQQSNTSLNQKTIEKERTIDSEQDAFFTLLNWAPNAEVIAHHEAKDIDRIISSYNILKEKKGVYWKALYDEGWIQAFENLNSR